MIHIFIEIKFWWRWEKQLFSLSFSLESLLRIWNMQKMVPLAQNYVNLMQEQPTLSTCTALKWLFWVKMIEIKILTFAAIFSKVGPGAKTFGFALHDHACSSVFTRTKLFNFLLAVFTAVIEHHLRLDTKYEGETV